MMKARTVISVLCQQFVRHQFVLVAVAATVFFTNLGGVRLWDRDEPRNAGCAEEMLAAGDWVVPVFNAELRPHKPVLLYWLMMSAYTMFGVSEFSARFWSALCGVGTVLATYHIGRRMFHPEAGLWAAIVLATTMMFGVASRAATPDALLIFCSTAALMVYVLAAFPREPGNQAAEKWTSARLPTLVLMYGIMGLGVLAKGPVGLVLPMAVIGMFLLIMRLPERPEAEVGWAEGSEPHQENQRSGGARCARPTLQLLRLVGSTLRPFAPMHFLRTAWGMRPLLALAVAMAIALPWYLWVGMRTRGEFLEGFFLTHNLGRAVNAMEGHKGPVFYYLVALFLGFLPWSTFFGPVVVDLWRRLRRGDAWRPGLVFAACWVGVFLGIFTLAQTKLPSYITPAYPGVALIVGAFLYRWTRGESLVANGWFVAAFSGLAVAGLAATVALPLAAHRFLPGEEWLGALGLIPVAGAAVCFALWWSGRTRAAVASYAACAVLLATSLFALAAWRVDQHQQSHVLLAAIERAATPQTSIACYGCQEPSWTFYAKRPIPMIPKERPADLARFLALPDRFVITTRDRYEAVLGELPAGVTVIEEVPYFQRPKKTLVVLGHGTSVPAVGVQISRRPTSPR